jgi:hypothetical protein
MKSRRPNSRLGKHSKHIKRYSVESRSTGWFAAGWQFGQALGELPDAAFKLYAWLCLNVDRHTGSTAEHRAGAFFGFEETGVLDRSGAARTGRTGRMLDES